MDIQSGERRAAILGIAFAVWPLALVYLAATPNCRAPSAAYLIREKPDILYLSGAPPHGTSSDYLCRIGDVVGLRTGGRTVAPRGDIAE